MVYLVHNFTLPIPMVTWITIMCVVVLLVVIMLLIILPTLTFSIVVSENYIHIRALPLLNVKFSREEVEHIEVIDLNLTPQLHIKWRTWGIGLPGWKVGWFKLANGANAFVAISSYRESVVIKLKDGKYVILSPKEFNIFKSTLKLLNWLR